MNKIEKIQLRFGILACIILIAGLSRLLPHPPNFTPIGAMALFGGAYFANRRTALLVPMLALWLSDLILMNGVYAYQENFVFFYGGFYWVYGTFILIVLMGSMIKKVRPFQVLTASLSASILFYVISNFGVWLGSSMYPQTLTGLLSCYVAGIPFFGNTIAGDFLFSSLMFGCLEMAKYKFPLLSLK